MPDPGALPGGGPPHDGATGTAPPDMRARIIAWAIGFAPVILILTTWGENLEPAQRLARSYALPVLAVEISIILLSFREGLRLRWPPWHISACLVALVTLLWVTALRADHPDASILHTSIWMIHLLYGISIANIFIHDRFDIDGVIEAIMWSFLILLAIFIAFVAMNYREIHSWTNDIPAFNNIRWFGYYAAAVTGLCAGGWLENKKFHSIIAAVALGAALWTGSRGALAAVVGGYMVAYMFFPFARDGTRNFLVIVLSAFLLASLATWLAPLGDNGPQRLIGADGSNGRIALWHKAVEGIAQRPWFGWGEAQYNYIILPLNFAQPHNVVLQILFAWGIVGASLIAWLASWLARRIRIATNRRNAPVLFAALNILALSLIDGSLYHVQSTSLFVFCVAMLAVGQARNR